MSAKPGLVTCPICSRSVPEASVNFHLDTCANRPAETSTSTIQRSGSFLKRKASAIDLDESDAPRTTPDKGRFKSTTALESVKPLPERARPSTLEDFVGQEHLLGKGALLRSLIDRDNLGSLVLWGSPGTGKTTLARIIATTTKAQFKELSATNTSLTDLRLLFTEAINLLKLTGRKTCLFVDEVQRFSKSQQDVFLPEIERGTVQCIFATTENPSFRLQNALLSRCRVFVLEKLSVADCLTILKRAMKLSASTNSDAVPTIDDDLLEYLAAAADGDARVALSSLELALAASDGTPLRREALLAGLRKAHLQYDRNGDNHFDHISALHKSVRGSDADAALYWLARMLEGGEDPLYVARRIIRMAAEDIGGADAGALPMCVAGYQAVQLIGMPECDCILAQCVVRLAEAPKSVRVYKAYGAAKALVRAEPAHPVPLHIRNAPTKLMKSLDYGKEYRYEPAYAHPVYQTFLPPELEGRCDFLTQAGNNKLVDEALMKEWEQKRNEGQPWSGRSSISTGLRDNGDWLASLGVTESINT